jgi:hypothetical protein
LGKFGSESLLKDTPAIRVECWVKVLGTSSRHEVVKDEPKVRSLGRSPAPIRVRDAARANAQAK